MRNFALFAAGVLLRAQLTHSQQLPAWDGPSLNPLEPLGGVTLTPNVTLANVFKGTPAIGTFCGSPMLDFDAGQFLVSWPLATDSMHTAGATAIYYSQSTDGGNWTATDGTNILFPNITYFGVSVTMNALPFLHINGSTYAAASSDGYTLYPDIDPQILLLRRVYTPGFGRLGPIFWATSNIQPGYVGTTKQFGFLLLNQTDATTQADIATLSNVWQLPCDTSASGSWNCPACLNGCQEPPIIHQESSIYHVPGQQTDVLFFRPDDNQFFLLASTRSSVNASWVGPTYTTIPDIGSTFDSGSIPSGKVFLLSNAMPTVLRDPLYVSTSVDGWNFNATTALTSCSLPIFESAAQPSGCFPRYDFQLKEFGAQYPQSVVLVAPGFQGMWVAFSLNSEDIWVLHVPFESLP
jgi:hypothetical protein